VLVPAYAWSFYRKTAALRALAERPLLARLAGGASVPRQAIKAALAVLAFLCIVVALTEPKWNPQPQQVRRRGRDVVILLDTSRSMLAEDMRPNRLESAKIAISDLLEVLRGDRIGIVTFAGNATVKCPRTQDYSFVRMALSGISTESTSRGGSLLGDAIRMATEEVFDAETRKYRDLILITDGEDHGSFPVQAAEKAAEEGIRIIAIGLGDDTTGARIPITGPDGQKVFLTHEGQEVWTKLDSATLRQVAASTEGGSYLSVVPGTTMDLGRIYRDLVASAEKRELEATMTYRYDEKFQVFIALAIGLLFVEVMIGERKKSR
jgi:Ca-activated chloride channel family protein